MIDCVTVHLLVEPACGGPEQLQEIFVGYREIYKVAIPCRNYQRIREVGNQVKGAGSRHNKGLSVGLQDGT